jgi:peptidoglycan/xylan/chitin deacetylase (PgdA/CDA1 family)
MGLAGKLESAALAAIGGPFAAPVLSGLERASGDGRYLRIITYHRVADPDSTPDLDPGTVSATPAQFKEQLEFLSGTYQVVSLEQVLCAMSGGRTLPARAVWITFDDAYEDFASIAWPMLQERGFPVTLFVPTAFPDQPGRSFWWDHLHQALTQARVDTLAESPVGPLPIAGSAQRLEAARRLKSRLKDLPHNEAMEWMERITSALGCAPSRNPVLGWEALRRLATEGVSLCPHTRTHPLLDRIPEEEAINEARWSLEDLKREIGPTPAVLAYPAGSVGLSLSRRLAGHGFELAVTTAHGVNDLRSADPLRLRRINVGRRTSLGVLRSRLLTVSAAFNWTRPLPA